MARPRTYVNEKGHVVKTATGVSYHAATRRFYCIDASGRRQYFRGWHAARAAYIANEQARMTEEERAIHNAQRAVRAAALRDKLRRDGRASEADDLVFEEVAEQFLRDGRRAVIQYFQRLDAQAAAEGIPEYVVSRKGAKNRLPGLRPKLSEVLADWEQGKRLEGVGSRSLQQTRKYFKVFADAVGNKTVSDLTPADFRTYYDQLLKNKGARSGRWYMEQVKAIKSVLRFARRRHPSPEWAWPNGISEWAEMHRREPVTAKREYRQPLPADAFARLLLTADAWAAVDPEAIAKENAADYAARSHAKHKKREGLLLGAVLRLAANAALSNVDIERVERKNLKLDAAIPHLDLPRKQTARSNGPVERLIPLLPSVVAALRRWFVAEGVKEGLVFRTKRKLPYTSGRLSDAFGRLRRDAGLKTAWSMKHIRNIAPSVGKKHKRPADERESILGHACAGTRAFYEGDPTEAYLVDLVNLVGDAYFAGEHVGSARALSNLRRSKPLRL